MRVIQDSDDELEDDLEADLLPSKEAGASSMQLTNDATLQPGTGSTDSLKRAIETAHRTHLQSQSLDSNLPVGNEPPSSLSLPEHRNKRQRTSTDVSPRRSPSAASIKNGSITYEKRSQTVFSSPAMVPVEDQFQTGKSSGIHREGLWGLEGTMRNDYAQHDPMMFPDPSSTVPNATFTQQRMLEAVAAPALLGIDAEPGTPYQPEPSIPWSDYLKLSPGDGGEQPESSNQGESTSQLAPALTPATLIQTPRKIPEVSTSQRSRRGSSVLLRGSPLKNEIRNSDGLIKVDAPPSEVTLSDRSNVPPTGSTKSHGSVQDGSQQPPRQRKSQVSSLPIPDDDAAAIGLPEEQYKPRPSRSRSLKVNAQEPIDYSVKPEKATRARRRKTTNEAGSMEIQATPQKVQQICDMGFSPTTTKRALKQNNGDITQTIEWLVTNRIDHDELAPQNSPKSKSKSKGKNPPPVTQPESVSHATFVQDEESKIFHPEEVAKNIPSESDIEHNRVGSVFNAEGTPDAAQSKSPKVQVVIAKKSPKISSPQRSSLVDAPNKKPKRRKTTLDQPESTPEEPIAPKATTEKKKGRGRPKKAAKSAISTEFVQEEQEEVMQKKQQASVLQSIEPNTNPPKRKSDVDPSVVQTLNDERIPERPEVEPLTPPPALKVISGPVVSGTPDKSTKPASRSPVNKGKVPHRVGLSKRARIAPLLRILKK
ncbi:hypothetical protein P153DRAFT_383598 [Dothidotthia symphoricarpi CBS 119687]|uniref:UBA domain-containing protein n=1 Tax=Dothidotthia symphoricarpi CBS 119687 TaxID=1392245 RepID=A0A6A6AK69_9PLEO|nr:uncharacterized protein P153DRAFT_383598 [Dothidotthia symphoricarpi CBS 119687]KAF2131495.1 hypothetical protein P153DRAFT_383598 [Dothidotthia symphoricarpi CBS 119687]